MPDENEYLSEQQRLQEGLGIRYPLKKFAEDLAWCSRTIYSTHPEESPLPSVSNYFAERYSGDAGDKMRRCLAAASYWEKNREVFDTGTVAVVGDEKSLISAGLTWALWIGWCRDKCDWRNYNPPVDAMIDVAEGYNKSTHAE